MGNYIFTTSTLVDALRTDAESTSSKHDMGGNIIPLLTEAGEAWVYDFDRNQVPGETEREHGYWRDVGTLDAYYQASMDLVSVEPIFNLYNMDWPILTWHFPHPPAKFVHESGDRAGRALNSLVSHGAVVSGGLVRGSILSPGVSGQLLRIGGGLRALRERPSGTERGDASAPSSTRTWRSPMGSRSGSTSITTAAGSPSPTTGWR